MTVDLEAELTNLLAGARAIYSRAQQLDLTTGVVGKAKDLVKRLETDLAYFQEHGGPETRLERLAMNAWRVATAADSNDGELPSTEAWLQLDTKTREQWRGAAEKFLG